MTYTTGRFPSTLGEILIDQDPDTFAALMRAKLGMQLSHRALHATRNAHVTGTDAARRKHSRRPRVTLA